MQLTVTAKVGRVVSDTFVRVKTVCFLTYNLVYEVETVVGRVIEEKGENQMLIWLKEWMGKA